MKIRAVVLCFVLVASSAVGSERVLLPITSMGVPGAHGSIWTTSVLCRNDSDVSVFVAPLRVTDFSLPPRLTLELPLQVLSAEDPPGQFVYFDELAIDHVRLSIRVRDVTRPAPGVDIKAVRDRDFTSDPMTFLNVPAISTERIMLRIYEADATGTHTAIVRVYRLSDDQLLLTENVTLPYRGLARYSPGYAEVRIPPMDDPLRVEVTPGGAGSKLWSFITLTNAETSEIALIYPH